jgi:hypothetical protein
MIYLHNFNNAITSATVFPLIKILFVFDVSPDLKTTEDFGRESSWARTSVNSLFAFPSTGAHFTRILSASPKIPSIPLREERGCALTFTMTPSADSVKQVIYEPLKKRVGLENRRAVAVKTASSYFLAFFAGAFLAGAFFAGAFTAAFLQQHAFFAGTFAAAAFLQQHAFFAGALAATFFTSAFFAGALAAAAAFLQQAAFLAGAFAGAAFLAATFLTTAFLAGALAATFLVAIFFDPYFFECRRHTLAGATSAAFCWK